MAEHKKPLVRSQAARALPTLFALLCIIAARPALAFPAVIMGDSRNDPKHVFPRIIQESSRIPNLRFAIHLGDMTGGSSKKEFDYYKKVTGALKVPMYSIPGNHDIGGGGRYRTMLGSPCYSRQEGRWRFIFIDNSKGSVDDTQLKWITKELESASAAKDYTVFAMHAPLYCPPAGGHIMSESKSRNRLLALAKRYRVKLVLAAHFHGYGRYVRDGVMHITTGGAGAPLVDKKSFYHYLSGDFRDDGSFDLRVVKIKG